MTLLVKEFALDWREHYPIFSSPAFLASVGDNYGWIGGYSDDQLLCFLPFTTKSRAVFSWVVFHTATVFIDHAESDTNIERHFLDEVVDYFRRSGKDFIAQGPTHAIFRAHPAGSVFTPFGSYQIDLRIDKSELWANLHGKHRNVIRNAEQKGVEIIHSRSHLHHAYEIMKMTMSRQGLSFKSEDDVARLVSCLGNNVEVFIATFKGQTQGCAVIPYSKYAAYYLLGGSIQNPLSGSLNLLHWVSINYFKDLGVRTYDFVGARIAPPKDTKLEGIQRFKERFGSRMAQGYLWKYRYSIFKYIAYATLMKIKMRQRYLDIIDQELEFEKQRNLPYV